MSSFSSASAQNLGAAAADQTLPVLQAVKSGTGCADCEEPLTLTVLGHQCVRRPHAYGLLLRTKELGDVVFALLQAILQRLTADLRQLASSPPPPGT